MKKIGVFVCTGCDVCKDLDLEGIDDEADDELGAQLCKHHEFLCGAEGVELIKTTIEEEELDAVAIAACTGRIKQDEFDFGPDVMVERVPWREMVSWGFMEDPEFDPDDVEEDEDSNIQMQALDYLRFAMAKLKKAELPEPFLGEEGEEFSKDVLVVGGGVAGLNAALNAADAGYDAVLVEKEAELGGLLGKVYKEYPQQMPFVGLQESSIPALAKQVEDHKHITVHTSSTIETIAGAPGKFDVTLKNGNGGESFRTGAIVLASGGTPYDASKLGHLGYGKSKNVVTSMELEEMAANGGIKRPSDGKAVKSVAFIQCAGSRDEDHLPYCSGHCCMTSLKQALYVREQDADAKAYIFYKDMRTPGHYEEFYRQAQDDEGVFLTKGEVASIEESGGTVKVSVDDSLLGEKIEVDADLVVLATGLEPTTKTNSEYDDTLLLPIVTEDDEEKKTDEDEEKSSGRPPAKILNLEYRQGPELPNLKYGFPDSHFICFPYETRRTGIYAAGTVRIPMDGLRAAEDGAGAALKAIQCVEQTALGAALHPRSGDLSYPDFFMQRCTQCKRCTEECPFGAINEDEKGNPLPEPTRCRRCGTCMGACPERIISFKDYGVALVGDMIKSMEVPDEFEEKPRILVLACENDAMPALEIAATNGGKFSPWVRFMPLRCLGGLNLVWIADALSRGIDGIMLLGCKYGEDYQCHFVKGSELCSIRLSKVAETLDRLALDSERIQMEQVQLVDYPKLPKMINDFADTISELEPNPYK